MVEQIALLADNGKLSQVLTFSDSSTIKIPLNVDGTGSIKWLDDDIFIDKSKEVDRKKE